MSILHDGFQNLHPTLALWFKTTFGHPTPAQQLGWQSIQNGQSTLIFAPTGSGKTLAAFVACLDHLWRTPKLMPGVRILYISPLKALNEDVSRNLEFPLSGVEELSRTLGNELPHLTIGVRSGDTPSSERQKMVRKPPDILITTPESLHLLLTSQARKTLQSVSYVIVDEIHALCSTKRGVFLSLLLERLEALNPQGFLRIGLSATQRPLEEVARYLGGGRRVKDEAGHDHYEPRFVHIVDTGQKKDLDLQVISPFSEAISTQTGSVWPDIERLLFDYIRGHRSTIIFANNRRVVERLTAHLNELAETSELKGENWLEFAKSHHGSLNLAERRQTEESLKRGELAAVVATASLELGIDMGAVDLVCQVESPGSISRGLQRVGRAGHFVGRTSRGRLIAKTPGDLLESAALCSQMKQGLVERLRVPTNCLDVLAQQVAACVAMDTWSVNDLFDLVRQAYSYRDLPASAFESVLKMLSGRFPADSFRDLRARLSWDRVHNRLAALPGTAKLALLGGGTIPETGQYPVYLGEGGPRLGELDEEFVLERRVGETFVLGTATWRIEAIEPLKVVVGRAEGRSSLMPFWRGEDSPRTAELGEAVAAVSREIAERIDDPTLADWLVEECNLDFDAAESLIGYFTRQLRAAGAVPDANTVLVETFLDPAGELGLAILTPFGGRLHHPLKLALQGRLRERFGIESAILHADDGILIRIPNTTEPPLNVLASLTPDIADALIRDEIGESALFGLRFRQNAGRSLLMPRPDPSKRTPLWLQRLRARDLLQVVRHFPDFPVVVETHRECLNDDLDLARLREFLGKIQDGSIRVVERSGERPSPFASELIFRFEHKFLYEWDDPKRAKSGASGSDVDDSLLNEILDAETHARWLDPNAIGRVENRLRGVGHPPRSAEEMAETLRQFGDLAPSELFGPMAVFLGELESQERAKQIRLEGTLEPLRWISSEESEMYETAFAVKEPTPELDGILARYFRTHALVGLVELRQRYPIDLGVAIESIERLTTPAGLVRLQSVDGDGGDDVWVDSRNLTEIRRLSIALKRKESVAVAPEVFADFLVRHQGAHPIAQREGQAAVGLVLEQLQGFAATADAWETLILPARVANYRPEWLDDELAELGYIWRAGSTGQSEPKIAFANRDLPYASIATKDAPEMPEESAKILGVLEKTGAAYLADLARISGLEPTKTRSALDDLTRRGLVSNDRFEPLRTGSKERHRNFSEVSSRSLAAKPGIGRYRPGLRNRGGRFVEGRWFHIDPIDSGDRPEDLLAWSAVLLERYGVLTREMAALEPWAPAWKDLLACLSRAEMRGEVRRGFFVEGLSGIQFANAETAEELARLATRESSRKDVPVLISTLDPANLYGSGAPFDIHLLAGGTARLSRSFNNDLVLMGGRPVLIIESAGKKLTGMASASEDELKAAVALLPKLAKPSRRVIKVESYNEVAALASPAAPWLAEAGFVRDHPGMAFYGGW